jgi:hypothetical protein
MKSDIHIIRIKPSRKPDKYDAWDDGTEKRLRKDKARVIRLERRAKCASR